MGIITSALYPLCIKWKQAIAVPGDGFCFIAALLTALHEKGLTISVDELIIAIQEEISGNIDHYMNSVEAKCTPLVIKAKVLQYLTQKSTTMMLLMCVFKLVVMLSASM